MLEYDKIEVSEGIDVNKTIEQHRCITFNYYYFLKVNFRFQPKACNGCHDLMQKAMSFMMLQFFLLKEMVTELIFGK